MIKEIYGTYAKPVSQNGYQIIPLRPETKEAFVKNWPHVDFNKISPTKFKCDALGVKCGARHNYLMDLDCDIDDPIFSMVFRQRLLTEFPHLKEAILIEGTYPHFSFIVRTPQFNRFWRAYTPPTYFTKGLADQMANPIKSKLEIKYNGRQVAIFSNRNDQPYYTYPTHSFLDRSIHDLPILTREQFYNLIQIYNSTAKELGLSNPKENEAQSQGGYNQDTSAEGMHKQLGDGPPAEFILDLLQPIINRNPTRIIGKDHAYSWQISKLAFMLSRIPVHYYDNTEFWLAFTSGMKDLTHKNPEDVSIAQEIWDTISQTSPFYNPINNQSKWQYRKSKSQRRIHTLGTIVKVAQLTGNFVSGKRARKSEAESIINFLPTFQPDDNMLSTEITALYEQFCDYEGYEPENSKALLTAIRDAYKPNVISTKKKSTYIFKSKEEITNEIEQIRNEVIL